MTSATDDSLPLSGIKVLDFSTLLPGPLATLILAEAGADIVKIERPGEGDAMRAYPRLDDGASLSFALLNRGKRSLALDLKEARALERLRPLIREADVLVEQFRPGVMARLGLGYEALSRENRRLVYCSITGYGQDGPKSAKVGHDLTYMAESGLLALAGDRSGAPVVPPVLVADIAGGSYPAVINILLALRQRDRTGTGAHLDIAMAEQVMTFGFAALAELWQSGAGPKPAASLLTGGSPRYRLYPTADGRHLAVAPLEERFWQRFADLIGLAPEHRAGGDAEATGRAVASLIAARPASHWERLFAQEDVSCAVVATLAEAMADPQLVHRRLFDAALAFAGKSVPALPVPVVPGLRRAAQPLPAPNLGQWVPKMGGWARRD